MNLHLIFLPIKKLVWTIATVTSLITESDDIEKFE